MPHLPYGCNQALPKDVQMAWGARLIFPDDLLWDRQGCLKATTYEQEHMKPALLDWLSSGAGDKARAEARRLANTGALASRDDDIITLYEDDQGIIKGSPQASFGYLYIGAWLHAHVNTKENA